MAEFAICISDSLDRYRRELARIPGITAAECARMAAALNRAQAEADAEAARVPPAPRKAMPARQRWPSIACALALGVTRG